MRPIPTRQATYRVGAEARPRAGSRAPARSSDAARASGTESEVTVDQRNRAQLVRTLQELHEGGIAHELVTCADEEVALMCQAKQLVRFRSGLDERLLHVHVGAGTQGLTSRLEVGAGRRADMHDIRLRFGEQGRHCGINRGLRPRLLGKSRCGGLAHIIYACDAMLGWDVAQGSKVVAGHHPSTHKGDAERASVRHKTPKVTCGALGSPRSVPLTHARGTPL